VSAPALGGTRRELLGSLKHGGPSTIPVLAGQTGLNVETVRHHIQGLAGEGLVERVGTRQARRGRPETVYGLTAAADSLFPRREGEMLRALVVYLLETGNEDMLKAFFEAYIGERRGAALARVEGLEGEARLEEAARILSELGFMALVQQRSAAPELRLCHCPLRDVVEVTRIPCRAELRFVRELVGEQLTRLTYIPSGDDACTYRAGAA
jgi:predicted ArsR family transcriptional regulator